MPDEQQLPDDWEPTIQDAVDYLCIEWEEAVCPCCYASDPTILEIFDVLAEEDWLSELVVEAKTWLTGLASENELPNRVKLARWRGYDKALREMYWMVHPDEAEEN
jgi:hypothetical protein